MTLKLGFIGIVTHDMAASLAFYRALGVDIAQGQDDAAHVDAKLDDGVTLAWDTIETIRGFDPASCRRPVGIASPSPSTRGRRRRSMPRSPLS